MTLVLILMILAVARVNRLVVADTIWKSTRTKLQLFLDRQGFLGRKLAELISCTWCVGIWASALLWGTWWHLYGPSGGRWFEQLVIILATAYAASFLNSWEGAEHE